MCAGRKCASAKSEKELCVCVRKGGRCVCARYWVVCAYVRDCVRGRVFVHMNCVWEGGGGGDDVCVHEVWWCAP